MRRLLKIPILGQLLWRWRATRLWAEQYAYRREVAERNAAVARILAQASRCSR